jgi:hypothetical protein
MRAFFPIGENIFLSVVVRMAVRVVSVVVAQWHSSKFFSLPFSLLYSSTPLLARCSLTDLELPVVYLGMGDEEQISTVQCSTVESA